MHDQLKVVQRVSRLMDTMRKAQDNSDIRRRAAEICRVPARGYSTTEFDMPEVKLKALVEGGRLATAEHLRQRGLV
jgi:hypothetical protein